MMALNPTLRVIRIRESNVFDRQSLAMIREMIQADGYQVWLEWVDDTGMVGIQIEDGMIKGAEPLASVRRLTTPRQPAAPPSGPPPPAPAPTAAKRVSAAPLPVPAAVAPPPSAPTPPVAPAPPAPQATGTLPLTPPAEPKSGQGPLRPPVRTPTYATRSMPKPK